LGENILGVLTQLGLPKADLYLFGDGSGTTIDKPCGCACLACRLGKYSIVHEGGFSKGTNNFAELIPYIHALYYDEYLITQVDGRKVEIVSDSELTVKQGNGEYYRNKNRPLWAAIESFSEMGYKLHWNHVSRNNYWPNILCDSLAGENRRKFLDSRTEV
jgi:ribonuclease HI